MTFVWKNLSVYSIIIDGQFYSSNSKSIDINLEKGIHSIDLLISKISLPQLRTKILLNWISNFCGAVDYTIEEAIFDANDDLISFHLTVDDCNACLTLDDYILSVPDLKMTQIVNTKKYNLVKILYLLPLVLLGGALGATFLTLGLITIRNHNIGTGIFSIVIAILSFILSIGLIIKVVKRTRKKTNG